MTLIRSSGKLWRPCGFELESDLELAILELQEWLFGSGRIYLDVKRLIGIPGNRRNIPDGYLIDLTGRRPRLFVVENELAWHDPLDHIAVQILQFSLSFESDHRRVRSVVFDAIHNDEDVLARCNGYVSSNEYRNLDHFVDDLVFNSPFSALVIIDELSPRLEKVLAEKFRFEVRLLTLERFESEAGEQLYRFDPFDEEAFESPLVDSESPKRSRIPEEDIDTVVTPEHAEGISRWLEEQWCWCRKIPEGRQHQIRYIAVYQIAPVSAITHIAEVASIEPRDDNLDWVHVHFAGPPLELPKARQRKLGGLRGIRTRRYTSRKRLLAASNLDEVFYAGRECADDAQY